MRVTRQQAERNRERVIETAGRLFRENGFDGIGLKDLMAGAGLTQGGFYRQFASKDELAALATRRALEETTQRWIDALSARPAAGLGAVRDFYLSEGHSAERAEGCPIVALGSDAVRQGPEIKAAFEDGIRGHLEMIAAVLGADRADEAMVTLSTMVGAVLLSRIVNDRTLSQQILAAAADALHAREAAEGSVQ